ncbi:MAG: HEPN domain-containing protein [Thermoplasmataceae archaeon]
MTSDEVEILRTRSFEYLEEAERLVLDKKWDLAMSSLHLHCELGLKSRLLEFGATYPRTYSLRELIRILSKFDPKISILLSNENSIPRLSRLEDGYISSRYLPIRYSRVDVEPLMKFVKEEFDGHIF